MSGSDSSSLDMELDESEEADEWDSEEHELKLRLKTSLYNATIRTFCSLFANQFIKPMPQGSVSNIDWGSSLSPHCLLDTLGHRTFLIDEDKIPRQLQSKYLNTFRKDFENKLWDKINEIDLNDFSLPTIIDLFLKENDTLLPFSSFQTHCETNISLNLDDFFGDQGLGIAEGSKNSDVKTFEDLITSMDQVHPEYHYLRFPTIAPDNMFRVDLYNACMQIAGKIGKIEEIDHYLLTLNLANGHYEYETTDPKISKFLNIVIDHLGKCRRARPDQTPDHWVYDALREEITYDSQYVSSQTITEPCYQALIHFFKPAVTVTPETFFGPNGLDIVGDQSPLTQNNFNEFQQTFKKRHFPPTHFPSQFAYDISDACFSAIQTLLSLEDKETYPYQLQYDEEQNPIFATEDEAINAFLENFYNYLQAKRTYQSNQNPAEWVMQVLRENVTYTHKDKETTGPLFQYLIHIFDEDSTMTEEEFFGPDGLDLVGSDSTLAPINDFNEFMRAFADYHFSEATEDDDEEEDDDDDWTDTSDSDDDDDLCDDESELASEFLGDMEDAIATSPQDALNFHTPSDPSGTTLPSSTLPPLKSIEKELARQEAIKARAIKAAEKAERNELRAEEKATHKRLAVKLDKPLDIHDLDRYLQLSGCHEMTYTEDKGAGEYFSKASKKEINNSAEYSLELQEDHARLVYYSQKANKFSLDGEIGSATRADFLAIVQLLKATNQHACTISTTELSPEEQMMALGIFQRNKLKVLNQEDILTPKAHTGKIEDTTIPRLS